MAVSRASLTARSLVVSSPDLASRTVRILGEKAFDDLKELVSAQEFFSLGGFGDLLQDMPRFLMPVN